jgi:hypothetical protein
MLSNLKNHTNIKIDSRGLDPDQIRLLKRISHMLAIVLKTTKEDEYFEGSAEIMRLCASTIKLANFRKFEAHTGIPYDDQALEYSLELLADDIESSKVVTYDN